MSATTEAITGLETQEEYWERLVEGILDFPVTDSYARQESTDEIVPNIVPRGECLTGPDCEWVACRSLSEFMKNSGRLNLSSTPLVQEEDPWAIMADLWDQDPGLEPGAWVSQQAAILRAVELFAKSRNLDAALEAAGRIYRSDFAINQMMRLFPHTDELYSAVRVIARSAPDIKSRLALNAQIEAYRHGDSIADRKAFFAALGEAAAKLVDTMYTYELSTGAKPAL